MGISPRLTVALGLWVVLFLLWFWCVRCVDLVYLGHYFDALCGNDFFRPGGAVRFFGAIPSRLAAEWGVLFGGLGVVGYSAIFLAGMETALGGRRADGRYSLRILLALPPLALLTILIVYQKYYHFSALPSGYYFGAPLALGIPALLAALWGRIERTGVRVLTETAAILLFYPLFGAYVSFFGLFLARGEWFRTNEKRRLLRTVFPLILALAAPMLWYRVYAGCVPFETALTAGWLPNWWIEPDEATRIVSQRLFIAALILTALPAFLPKIAQEPNTHESDAPISGEAKPNITKSAATQSAALAITVVLAFCGLIPFCSRTDENFLALLAMARPLERDDWGEILAIESRCAEPTLPLIELRRLALAETGKIGEQLFDRTNEPLMTEDLALLETERLWGAELLYRNGCVNHAIRAATNIQAKLWRRSPYCRFLIFQSALANGEYALARRHLALLEPLGRSDWTEAGRSALAALSEGKTPKSQTEQRMVDRALRARRLRPTDYVVNSGTVSLTILYAAAHRDPEPLSLAEEEITLCQLLLQGNLRLFEERLPRFFTAWNQERPGKPIPAVLQQGALFAEYQRTKTIPTPPSFGDPALVQRLAEMAPLATRFEQSGRRDTDAQRKLWNDYGQTFWYYYLFHDHRLNY